MKNNNIYDAVKLFYDSELDWNLILNRELTEEFIRLEVFKGTKDEDLFLKWEYIVALCYYVSNGTTMIGDLNKNDFIDSVVWCGRNIPNFSLDSENISSYLHACSGLLEFLKSKHSITDASAALAAEADLIVKGELQIINEDGSFKKAYQNLELNHTPDLKVQISMNEMGQTQHLIQEILKFFQGKAYSAEIMRASLLFFGEARDLKTLEENAKTIPNEINDFWDYFLYDYLLSRVDMTPLAFYSYDFQNSHSHPNKYQQRKIAVLQKLMEARLGFFTILTSKTKTDKQEVHTGDDIYNCRDFLTGETFNLCLPFNLPKNVEEYVFTGHIFSDGNILSDCVKSIHMGSIAQQKTRELLDTLRQLFAIQDSNNGEWSFFLRTNAALVISVFVVNTKFYLSDTLLGALNEKNYHPALLVDKGDICDCIDTLGFFMNIPNRDIALMTQLWSDYAARVKYKEPINMSKKKKSEDAMGWAIATMSVYLFVNHGQELPLKIYQTMFNYPYEILKRRHDEMMTVLKIKAFQPQYLGEEGLLTLAHLKN